VTTVPLPRQSDPFPPMPPIPGRQATRFSTVQEVARFLRVSKMTVYRLINAGTLPAYKFGQSATRIPTRAVWDYVKSNKIDPDNIERAKAL
jgi:excisionase family DNA binding protein